MIPTSKKLIVFSFSLMLLGGGTNARRPAGNILICPNERISTDYIGNGVQWDPYQLDYGHGKMSISEDDWTKLHERLDAMKPGFIRIMINTPSQFRNGKIIERTNNEGITPILDYCQSRNITVMFGDWGGSLINAKDDTVNTRVIDMAVEHLSYLVNERGYDCIKYYDFVNEPNGWWSSTKGDFNLWAKGMAHFVDCLQKTGLSGKVKMAAPDVAIWTADECWWMEKAAKLFDDYIGVYDIHTYPSKYTVNSGEYYDIVKAYRNATPSDKRIIMGEIGLKYVHPVDSCLNAENIRRASEQPYASTDDSQMSVFDFSYGIDMADALVQTVSAGYSGSIAWMLDDAMHAKEAPDKLKVWGFWNILGDEFFGSDKEKIRPWYYSWSLLCRYMPKGAEVLKSIVTDSNCKVSVVKSGNSHSIFIVNSSSEGIEAVIKSETEFSMPNVRIYRYDEKTLSQMMANGQMQPMETIKHFDLDNPAPFIFPANSLTVITNMN